MLSQNKFDNLLWACILLISLLIVTFIFAFKGLKKERNNYAT